MEFEEWKPFYDRVLEDMGYSREQDRRAAERLAELAESDASGVLANLLSDADVVVAGGGPGLEEDVSDLEAEVVVVAADSALPRLLDVDVRPDVVVTDLDGAPEETVELSRDGVPVAVHAHGDNVDLLESWLPELAQETLVPTCQCRPTDGVHCFGGFTDGDRAAYLADELGARSIELAGFDFDAAEGEKARKLDWAKELLEVLEQIRGEELLD